MIGGSMVAHEGFTPQYRAVGRTASWAVSLLLVIYVVTTALGFLSLRSPLDSIGDPYVSIMELLIIVVAPLMVVSMTAVHAYAPSERKPYSLVALILMVLMTGVTSSVHFVILSVGRQIEAAGPTWAPLVLSFRWPSVLYTLDILAWDWFFALSMLCAAPVFRAGRLELLLRVALLISGVLSLAGLLGVMLGDMQVRNVGIIGYSVVAIPVFLLLGAVLGRTRHD
jgi:hypothetical protein